MTTGMLRAATFSTLMDDLQLEALKALGFKPYFKLSLATVKLLAKESIGNDNRKRDAEPAS